MKTISLRYTDKFAPENGTIGAHNDLLKKNGYVWYGKMGNPISNSVIEKIMDNEEPRFLLIHSGSVERYWIYIDAISKERPDYSDFPQYYHDISGRFKTWFRVIRIEKAENKVMTKCKVISSGASLSEVSRHSMNPYYIIDYQE